MNSSRYSFILLFAVTLSSPMATRGQQVPMGIEMVERVVAIVGDSVILHTELEEFLIGMEARGWQRPLQPGALLEARLEILDQLINQQLIVQEAVKDSLLVVTEEELEDRVQQQIDGQVRTFGTLGRLQAALAEQSMTLAVYREQQKNIIRRQLLQERYFAKRGQDALDIVVTEEEARTYWNNNQDLIPERPPSMRFENVALRPEASDSAKAEALAEADSVLNLLRDGGDFAELAGRYSDEPGARETGGDLGWIREDGGMVAPFEERAFSMPRGTISPPVETDFGYHLINVERVRGGERRVRHILIQPVITVDDVEANDTRATSFAERLKAGETFEDLGLEPDTAELTLEQISQTSQSFAIAMQTGQTGDVIGPVRMGDPRSENGWMLAIVLERTTGGIAEFSEFRDLIVERLQQQGLTETVIEELRNRAYIDVRLGGD